MPNQLRWAVRNLLSRRPAMQKKARRLARAHYRRVGRPPPFEIWSLLSTREQLRVQLLGEIERYLLISRLIVFLERRRLDVAKLILILLQEQMYKYERIVRDLSTFDQIDG